MRTTRQILATLAMMLAIAYTSFAASRIQVIHNSADKAAQKVNVWIDNDLLLENFEFRTATPFIDVPSDVPFTLSIEAADSELAGEVVWSKEYTLEDGKTYILVAAGVLENTGFDPAIPFDIYVYDQGREKAFSNGNTDVLVFHGATDAPTVDLVEIGRGAGTLVDDLAFGEFDGYLELYTSNYIIDVRDESGENSVIAYSVPLEDLNLQDASLVAVASGFLNPDNNKGGEEFGIWVALPTGGDLIPLPVYQPTARVQVIHNSADLGSEVVDIWMDDMLLIDNFQFRTATPFIDAPAEQEFKISVKGPDSQNADDPIWSNNYTLETGKTYVLIANGIVTGTGYNPEKPFNIYVNDMGREVSGSFGNTDVLVFHGSTDAPTVDVVETGAGAGTIVNNIKYGEYAGYLELPNADYQLEIRDETGSSTVATYGAPLKTLGLENAALVTLASGFLNPAVNQNGEGFGLWVALPSGGNLIELPLIESNPTATARVQVIHNSADMAAEVVDVWLNDMLLIDNFTFRTASPFIDAPAGEEFTIGIKGSDSEDASNPIWSQTYTLEEGMTYVLVANGIVSAEGYDPAQPFDIYVYGMGRETATDMMNTDILVFHGSTDAPTVDVVEIGAGAGTIIDDFMYGEFAGYLELPTADYVLDIRDETGENSVVAYSAPLETLGLDGAALVTVASGFLNSDNNSGGEGFGLWVALPSGGNLVELPVYEMPLATARVQVIHNSADLAAATVDVWLNDALLLDDFMFRTASPFVDAPAGEEFTIAIKGPDSQDASDPIWSQNYTLEEGMTYVLVANGIVSSEGYDPVQPFDIYVYGMGREEASNEMNTDILVFHGSTDAPTVDVVEIGQGAGTIIDNFMYGDFAGYLELPTANYVLDIRDETGENSVVAYSAPLETLGLNGAALVTVASGFLNPDNNSGGESFGLWVALPTGGELIPLPVFEAGNARVQVIHNSADAAAAMVDVWLNDALLLDDFKFRTASPFVDAPAGVNLKISIKGPDSQDPDNPIWSMDYNLEDGKTYILVANGIVSPEGYDPVQPFDIYVYDMGREEASNEMNTDVLVFHGSTDAPTVDVVETGMGAGLIVDDLSYGMFDGYLELPTADYQLSVKDETGSTTVAVFYAPLETLGLQGAALAVVASGFLNPLNNSNGASFGLWAALPAGGDLVELPNITSVNKNIIDKNTLGIFPNPASSSVNINYALNASAEVLISVYNITGSIVKTIKVGYQQDTNHSMLMDISDLTNGLYFVNITAGNNVITKKLQVVN